MNCLQDANATVHEAAVKILIDIQTRGMVQDAATSAHLIDLLITSLFCSKRVETVEDATRSARMLLLQDLHATLPVLLKGTISRNLSSGLQSLVCLQKSMGVEIRGESSQQAIPDPPSPDLLFSLIDQLLRVIATAKVRSTCNIVIIDHDLF